MTSDTPGSVPAMVQVDEVGETLLRAASSLLATEGAGALTVRRIASKAGVSTMNVYSRFGSKDGVVDRLFMEGFTRLRDAMASVDLDDAIADLRECAQSYRRFALANPTYYAVMFANVVADYEPSAAAYEHAGGTLELLAQRLGRAMAKGAIPTADPLHTAAMVWATCHGVMSLELNSVGPMQIDWSEVYVHATDAIIAGLAAGRAGTTR